VSGALDRSLGFRSCLDTASVGSNTWRPSERLRTHSTRVCRERGRGGRCEDTVKDEPASGGLFDCIWVSPLRAVPACVRRLCTAPCSTYDHRPPSPQKPLSPPERAQCSAGRVRACTVCVSINGGQGSGERPLSFDYDTSLLTTCNDLGYEGVRGVPRDRPTGVPRS
jgi:hypothetical protein